MTEGGRERLEQRVLVLAPTSKDAHLTRSVLERAGLVTSTKAGRVRTYRLAPAALEVADGWLADQRRLWELRLDQLDEVLTHLKEQR